MLEALLSFLMFITAIFLILLILVQRGRGGGLAGVFGGPGGQCAFGAKAGDLFTRITIGVVAFWIVLCVVSIRILSTHEVLLEETGTSTPTQSSTPQEPTSSPSNPEGSGPSSPTESSSGTAPSSPGK